MLDMDGDGQVSFQELLGAIKEAFAARECMRARGRGGLILNMFGSVRGVPAVCVSRQSLGSACK